MQNGKFRKLRFLLTALIVLGAFASYPLNAHAAENGMVRVLLTRLGSRNSITLNTTCTYYIGDEKNNPIAKGEKVVCTVSGGKVVVYVDGTKRASGDKVVLMRGRSGNVGIQFKSPSQSNLFAGDLQLTVNSGKLYPVLNIYIEDYLYGVVGYEMANSYPLEALKAQAVVARSEAMAKKKTTGLYDVQDNTSDQVYKGLDPKLTNVIKSVDLTRGVLVYYNGKICPCYYGDSNGGQIETTKNMWGNVAGYSVMKDDPYDLENPASSVKRLKVVKKPGSANSLNAKLKTELIKAMHSALSSRGLKTGESSVDIMRVVSITPIAPRFPEPSRTFTKLRFVLDIKGTKAGSDERIQVSEIQCELKTYDNLKSRFSLGFQTSNREIVSVKDDGDSWGIEFRRWGHGIGMSQKGAQWMARQYGKNYKEILLFYLANVELRSVKLTDSTVGAGNGEDPAEIGETPTNTESTPDTPAQDSSLIPPRSLRTVKKGMSGADIKQLQLRLKQLGYYSSGVNGKCGNSTLAAARRFSKKLKLAPSASIFPELQRLLYAESAPKHTESARALVVRINLQGAIDTLPVRNSANAKAKVAYRVPNGESVVVLSISSKWCKIKYNGKSGYATNASFIFQ